MADPSAAVVEPPVWTTVVPASMVWLSPIVVAARAMVREGRRAKTFMLELVMGSGWGDALGYERMEGVRGKQILVLTILRAGKRAKMR